MIGITPKEFEQLAKYIKDHSGIHLKNEKQTLVESRLSSLLMQLQMSSYEEYYAKLKSDDSGMEMSRLLDKITTNHTYFMREAEHFIFFKNEVLPYLENKVTNRDLRIWCAASATGEEPYTLAFMLEDYFGNKLPGWDKKLLATDISNKALEAAVRGVYSSDEVKSLSKLWLMTYFTKQPNGDFGIKPSLKKEIIYRRFNLLEKRYPFKKKFHVIFCRNVMIYFDEPTKDKVIKQLYEALEPGGYLFVGHSESVNRNIHPFKYIQPAVYRKG